MESHDHQYRELQEGSRHLAFFPKKLAGGSLDLTLTF